MDINADNRMWSAGPSGPGFESRSEWLVYMRNSFQGSFRLNELGMYMNQRQSDQVELWLPFVNSEVSAAYLLISEGFVLDELQVPSNCHRTWLSSPLPWSTEGLLLVAIGFLTELTIMLIWY